MMNNYRFISRSVYRMRSIIREGNRDAMSKRDMRSHCGLLLIYQAMYVLSRVIRTYTFAFSLSAVQMKVCELTSCDLNIYIDVKPSRSVTYACIAHTIR